jgi:hypothetical protein
MSTTAIFLDRLVYDLPMRRTVSFSLSPTLLHRSHGTIATSSISVHKTNFSTPNQPCMQTCPIAFMLTLTIPLLR